MLKIGINENVLLSEVGRSEQGTITLKFEQSNGEPQVDLENLTDVSAMLNSSEDDTGVGSDGAVTMMLFQPQAQTHDGKPLDVKGILGEISRVKDPLNHILTTYISRDKVKWDLMKGTAFSTNPNMPKEQALQVMQSEAFLKQVYNNIVDQFTATYNANPSIATTPVRVLFVRRSKAKNFMDLRRKFLNEQPFIELMAVPADQSKLAFTAWEKKNGFDSDAPAETTPDKPDKGDSSSAEDMLGGLS